MCARRRSYFFSLRRKKVTKKRASPLSASPALRYGAACGARSGRGLARTRHCVAQTVASPDPPSPALLGADRGEGAEQPNSRAAEQPNSRFQISKPKVQVPKPKAQSPRPATAFGWCAQRKARADQAERSKGPSGCWVSRPCGCAEERSGQRIRACDCLSAKREFEQDPAGREHHRLPVAQRRDAATRVAFLWGTFLWRSKEKYLARRGETRPASLSQVRSSYKKEDS